MKVARTVTMVGLGLVFVGYLGVTACSSSSSSGTTSSVGGPPAKPAAPATTSTTEHTYALNALFLGDTDRAGNPSTTAWKKFGYNIDGKVSDKTSTDVCTPAAGAGKEAQVDGDNGIDNAFGSRIVPIIQTFSHDISKQLTDSIQKGSFTIMLDTVGLTDDPAQTNTALTGQLFAGGKLDNPTFTLSDKWPVRPELLNDGKTVASGSKVKFTDAFIVGGQWVNGVGTDVKLSLAFGGVALDINIHKATIVFNHAGADATNGTIAGVIDTAELINGLRSVAGRISDSLCSGSAFDSIAQQITQASDILTDGTNAGGTPCTAISIGIGFTAKEISPPTTVADLGTPSPDKCADAGTPPDDAAVDQQAPPQDAATE
jgi:hypothetical protein